MKQAMQTLKSWMKAYSLGVLDQFLVSGANFGVTVCLARWLSMEEFGIVALAQVLALYAGALHVSLVGEPFSVNFVRFPGRQLDDYVGWTHVLHLIIMVSVVVLFLVGALVASLAAKENVARIQVCASLFTVSCFSVWHTRRIYYALRKEREALWGTLAYLVVLGVGLGGLRYTGCLTACSAMAVMAMAGGVVMIPVVLDMARAGIGAALHGGWMWWHDHWAYAKWHLGGNAVTGLAQLVAYPVLAVTGGLGASASLRVVETFYAPFNQALTTLGLLVLPRLAVLHEAQGPVAVRRRLQRVVWGLVAVGVAITGGLFVVGEPLVVFLFGKEKGAGLGMAVALFGLVLVLRMAFDMGPALLLRVMRDTRAFFVNGWIVGLGGALLVGFAAAWGGVMLVIVAKILVLLGGGVVFTIYARRSLAGKER